MDLTRTAIEKSRVTAVVLLVVIGGGLWSWHGMSRAEDPPMIFRRAVILTWFPGASPTRVERLITDKVEAAVQQLPEIDFVTSRSKTGVSLVILEIRTTFDDMQPIWENLRRKVAAIAPELPAGVIGPTVDDEVGEVFGIIVTVTGDGYSYAEVETVAAEVRDELLRVESVAKVEVFGAQEEQIFVDYDNARLAEVGLAPLQLRAILESANMIMPGGSLGTGAGERIVVEPTGNFESILDLRRTVVTLPGRSETMYLEDLATISRGYLDPPQGRVFTSGAPALALAISMRDGGNVVALGAEVERELERLQAAYPIGVEFDVVRFQPEVIDDLVRSFAGSLVQAVGIVVAVLLVVLGLRTGLVVASLVPAAFVTSLFVMALLDIGLDQISLAALIIALGMVVDNAIVMAESIVVLLDAGRRPIEAAVDAARELRIPLLSASLTTAAAFLPIFLAESTTGQYTAPLFKVVTITLLSSWILTLTLTPLLCARFLRRGTRVEPLGKGFGREEVDAFLRMSQTSAGEFYEGRLYRGYRALLLMGLRHRVAALAALAVLFGAAVVGARSVPTIFFPPSDLAIFTAEYELPAGSSIERTTFVVEEVDRFIARELRADARRPPAGPVAAGLVGGTSSGVRSEGITNWVTFVGDGGPRFYLSHIPEPHSPDYAFSILNATSRAAITGDLIPRLEAFCRERFPDLDVTLKPLQIGTPITAPVEVRVSGSDDELLFDIAAGVKARLRATPGARNVTDDWGPRSKKLVVEVDQLRARRAGVSSQDVAISLQTALSGLETTQYRENDAVVPVMLRSTMANRADMAQLENLNVHAQATGRTVPLLQVADTQVVWEPSTVRRRNRIRTVTVAADVEPGMTPTDVVTALRPWLDEQQAEWPIGFRYEFGGEEEGAIQANRSILEKLPVGAVIILLLLVGQFNSLRRTAIILLTIPLGFIGVVVGLLVAQSHFGFMALLGNVALAGIVINNAIVLIDRIGIEMQSGLDPQRAIIGAVQRRLRPILLTTATTVAGLLPLWLAGGAMWEPMAVAIIFGLIFGTVLTLGVVPILYSLLFGHRFDQFEY